MNMNYLEIKECTEQNLHLTDCDSDGYCNFCGEQETLFIQEASMEDVDTTFDFLTWLWENK